MLKYTTIFVGSFMFLLLLCYIYNSKPRYSSIENRIFRGIMYSVLICMVLEFPSYITIHYKDSLPLLNELIRRISWISAICAVSLLSIYVLCLGQDYKVDHIKELIKEHLKFKLVSITTIIAIIVFLLLPFEYGMSGDIAFVGGPACYFILVGCIVVLTIFVTYFLFFEKNLDREKKIQIYFIAAISFIAIPLQVLFPYMPIITMSFCLDLYVLYFSLENPDLLLRAELEKMKNMVDESTSAKADFLSSMSHEIRSPMNAIIGFSESILESDTFDEDEIKKDINNIRIAGNGLIEIIDNILDISKIESGKEIINYSEYTIQEIYYELINITQTRIGNKNIQFITSIDEGIPSTLYGDKIKIYQILLNLLTNAVKYTEVGKIFFDVKGKVVGDKVKLSFSVSDTGCGIKKEDYDKVFNKFVRLDAENHNNIEGTGLGLAITKRLVTLLNGKITFTSEYEVGTTFNVELEQKIIDRQALGKLTQDNPVDKKTDYLDCSNYSVLLVDNNRLNLRVVERLLQPYGFKITSVTSGKEAIYKVKAGEKYDLIFLDHMMQEMDGIEIVHILKKLEYYDLPPIIALTANVITGMKEMYLKEGFDGYLPKPINVEELNKLINNTFKNRRDKNV